MDLIPSFQVDHNRIVPGIYESRLDTLGDEFATTFDIRMKKPNAEPAIHPNAMHTIEHIVATFLRNDEEWKDRIIYWGPMGCLTGNYLIVSGDYGSSDILPLMVETFEFIAAFEGEIPGATARDCGNYTFNDLALAKVEARTFLENTLYKPEFENLNYPQ